MDDKDPADRRLAGQKPVGLKTEQAAQHGIDSRAAAQLAGWLKAQNSFGHKGADQCNAAASGRPVRLPG